MIDFVLPSLGADMDQAMLVAWLVEPGSVVKYGQIVAELETDKGIIEVECWHDGVVEELLVEPSPTKLAVGTPLARIRLEDEAPTSDRPTRVTSTPSGPSESRPPTAPRPPTPPVRHLAHTLGVDIEHLAGTGEDGSVTREDVRKAARPKGAAVSPAVASDVADRVKASPRARALATKQGVPLEAITPSREDGLIVHADVAVMEIEPEEPEDKVAAMRRAITRSMSRSKREIPHYYLATTIDMSRALTWLEEVNSDLPLAKRILPA
ncbi:MAG TPA: E3 binding domain-containing protein, partial [Acidimicrobiia bacterium]